MGNDEGDRTELPDRGEADVLLEVLSERAAELDELLVRPAADASSACDALACLPSSSLRRCCSASDEALEPSGRRPLGEPSKRDGAGDASWESAFGERSDCTVSDDASFACELFCCTSLG